ncbi:MAG: MFS transporter [Calditrichaeota bacterium]|jgi:predicted MFS family arabinose efflux permease|nr:MFS transporter [Calditrichota bacterium]MBT7789355.1 MFS transporter [Calditrichota bacterium]
MQKKKRNLLSTFKFSKASERSGEMYSDIRRAVIATFFFGAAGGIFLTTLNNYLADVHHLDAAARGWLEFPRELPGFLIMLVSGVLLTVMRETQMAAVAMLLGAIGALGMGLFSPGMTLLLTWIIIWSLGDHINFVVEGVIGLRLSEEGAEGRRLGQLGGARNLGTIVGVGIIFILAKMFGDVFGLFYAIAAGASLLAGLYYLKINVGKGDPPARRMVLKKKYAIFYAISALFGIRKQIFLAFGGWVLVSMHGVSVSTVALLYFIAAAVGIVIRPLLGEVIDWIGERIVLAADEIIIIFVCMTYAFASNIFPKPLDLWILFAAYILDNVLFALRIARTTYLKKIADDPNEITSTISVGITIDHLVAMSLPIFSGYVWEAWGFQWVFIIAASIAFAGFFICLKIKVPDKLPVVG